MCGIAGLIDPGISPEEARNVLGRMLEGIAHRGPDARAVWQEGPMVFGHNRLSIIDLSTDGIQPMTAFGSVIVFNGEIYNYVELRKELEADGLVFRTKTDTEVILASYKKYGQECVKRFVGMWAFALWDPQQQLVFCSRDRFGIKPFHYIEKGNAFYFGSEYKALRPSPVFSSALNIDQALRGLQMGWNAYDDESYYAAVKTLPPGSNLLLKDGKVSVSRYWDIETSKRISGSFDELTAQFKTLFMDSIRIHMRSDVEVGACLSGGIDSSAIVSAVSSQFSESALKTFTVYYDGAGEVDERPWVKHVLDKYPRLTPFYFQPTYDDIASSFDKALYHADVPLAGSSPVSQYFVMRIAAEQKIKVLLDGQGSDEFLGGYLHSFYRLIGGHFRNLRLSAGITQLNAHARMQEMSGAKRRDVFLKSVLAGMTGEQRLYALEYLKYFPFAGKDRHIPFELKPTAGSRLQQFLYHLTFNSSLPTLLQFEDRNSMAFSIESRVPFLDHRLVEFAFSLPDDTKIDKGETKKVLRHALKGIMPEAIVQRKDKKGFVTPGEVKWLRGPLAHLLDTRLDRLDFLDTKSLLPHLEAFRKGDNSKAVFIWRLVVLDQWCRHYA